MKLKDEIIPMRIHMREMAMEKNRSRFDSQFLADPKTSLDFAKIYSFCT
jgi:hypothetical protein